MQSEAEQLEPPWRVYERAVLDVLGKVDPNVKMLHNTRADGRISGVPRQLDGLIHDQVAGFEVRVVVESKAHQRRVGVSVIDAFIGKLLDLGDDMGILAALSGFTTGAYERAQNARNPRIMPIALRVPDPPRGADRDPPDAAFSIEGDNLPDAAWEQEQVDHRALWTAITPLEVLKFVSGE